MLILLVTLFAGCSSDDSGEQSSSKIVNILKERKWISRDVSFGFGNNDHSWVDVEYTTLYFTTDNEGVVYWHQKDYDTDLGDSNNFNYNTFSYTVSGNKIVTYTNGYTDELEYSKDCLVAGSGIYQSYPMDYGDYELLKKIAPKSGSCGENLTYTYIPKTKKLTISGSGDMDNYTSTNQPWHSCYIEEVEIEDGCTSIGNNAFTNIKYVTDIVLPSSLERIGSMAFAGTLIDNVKLPTNLKVIGNEAFANCKYLKAVYFNNSLEEIGDNAFYGTCVKNSTLKMPESLKYIGNLAFSGWTTGNLTLNEKLESIGNAVFSGVKGTIKIPNSVKVIGNLAFDGSFNKVVIGTGLEHLSANAFSSSASTGTFYVNLGVPLDMDGYIFSGNIVEYDTQNKWILYVPKGSKKAYSNDLYWKQFKNIYEDNTLISGNGSPSDSDDEKNEDQIGKDYKEQNTIDAKDKRRGNVSKQFSGKGTKSSPYLIKSAADLRLLSDKCREGHTYKDEYFKLTTNIIINNNVTNSQGECNKSDDFERWIPIGCLEESPFCGTFEGDFYSIKGIYINRKVHGAVGLFGYFAGKIRNLLIEDSHLESTYKKCLREE